MSLPDELRAFMERRGGAGCSSSTSEDVRALIYRDEARQHLRTLLLDGAASELGPIVGAEYFGDLRRRVDQSG